jgi:D-3-phosphoglycerate dehydrogenase / 2-oxoglutarate reductase
MPRKVLVTDHVFEDLETERALLEPLGAEVILASGASEEILVEEAHDADALLVCYAKVTGSVIEAAADSGCRVISRYGIGYDNVDVEAATRRGLLVTYVPDYCLDEVADHTLALFLALARAVFPAAMSVRAGDWKVPQGRVHRLQGLRLLVVGMGGVGRRVAARARAFGLEVVGYDPFLEAWDIPEVERADDLDGALSEADVISLHTPLTPESRHLINERTIARMRRSPIVLNTARGGLVVTEALLRGLEEGRVGGAALDVTEEEPLPRDHPLREHPRVVITPHMAFYSIEAQRELQRRAAEEVVRALEGRPPDRPVNPEVLESSRS